MPSRPIAALTPVRVPLLVAALCVALLLTSAAGSSAASTPTPAGPRLAVVVVTPSKQAVTTEVVTIGPEGEDPERLVRGGIFEPISFFEHPNWSPDGRLLAFDSQGEETPAVALVGADGSDLHLLRSSEHLGGPDDVSLPEPLFDPRTGELTVGVLHLPNGESPFGDARPTGPSGRFRTEFWGLPVDGRAPRRLSSRPISVKGTGFIFPYSIASNGMIAATGLKRGFEVVVLDPRGGPVRRVVPKTTQEEGTLEPAISPDGTQVVYKVDDQREVRGRRVLFGTDLMIVPTKGGRPKLLARLKGGARWPSWDPSGSRIAFTALNAAGVEDSPSGALGDALMEINPDGTCLTKVFSVGARGAVEGAAWQPGADRGVGPLSC